MNDIPIDLDWVKERAACSLGNMFDRLKARAQSDTESRNSIAGNILFYFKPKDDSSFTVLRGDSGPLRCFILEEGRIIVQDRAKTEILRATITLNRDGRCLFEVKGESMEVWQVMRAALEPLFFG